MDIGDSPEEAAFRAEARAFLERHAEHKTPGVTSADELNRHDPNWMYDHLQRCREWQRVLYDNGWAGITWPKEFGGRGGTGIQQAIFAEEQAQFDVRRPACSPSASAWSGPTLIAHGTDEQQERYLDADAARRRDLVPAVQRAGRRLRPRRPRHRGRCATATSGSSTGRRCGHSGAQYSDWGILLARTDPDAPKHRGITYFLVDMRRPGIDVRPLRQITGVAHFNEVFLTDVRIPARERRRRGQRRLGGRAHHAGQRAGRHRRGGGGRELRRHHRASPAAAASPTTRRSARSSPHAYIRSAAAPVHRAAARAPR